MSLGVFVFKSTWERKDAAEVAVHREDWTKKGMEREGRRRRWKGRLCFGGVVVGGGGQEPARQLGGRREDGMKRSHGKRSRWKDMHFFVQ